MERHEYRHPENLVRQIKEERERFVAALENGANPRELSRIRQNIQELNDQLGNEVDGRSQTARNRNGIPAEPAQAKASVPPR